VPDKAADTGAAPPAEELLRAMPGECEADEDAKDEQASVHMSGSLMRELMDYK
jgi:hypothetical protein